MSITSVEVRWAVYRDDGALIRGPYDTRLEADISAKGLNNCSGLGNPSSYEAREFRTDDQRSQP